MEKRPLPIGISDFKKIIEGDYAYVDKTLLIQELVKNGSEVCLIPRMRRFGKTLNLSMLAYFFEKSKEDHAPLFTSLNIWQIEPMRALQGKFPVIFLTLKDVKFQTWAETVESFARLMANEFKRHLYLLEKDNLGAREKELFLALLHEKASSTLLTESLRYLTEWLHRFHGQKVILLIDEYDTPAHSAYVGNYYETLISFLRNWLSNGLKDNKSLERGVLTGILRIAKESVFSGLNNIRTFTLLNSDFYDKFGLLESEVKQLLVEYGLEAKLEAIRAWYNGYRIGAHNGIYNPWSVLNCIADQGALAPYWVNTSENALVKKLITQGTEELKVDFEALLQGKTVEKKIEEGIIFNDLTKSPNAVWALLLFSGYLTTVTSPPHHGLPYQLQIPNNEVMALYKSMVFEWFEKTIHQAKYQLLLKSLTSGDIDTFSKIFQEFIDSTVSVFDISQEESEKIYHAFVLGALLGLEGTYEVKSNRESGYGRYDVMLIPKSSQDLGIIFEFKKVSPYHDSELEPAVQAALRQIEEKNYAQELQDRGIKQILLLAIAFKGKKVAFLSKRTG